MNRVNNITSSGKIACVGKIFFTWTTFLCILKQKGNAKGEFSFLRPNTYVVSLTLRVQQNFYDK